MEFQIRIAVTASTFGKSYDLRIDETQADFILHLRILDQIVEMDAFYEELDAIFDQIEQMREKSPAESISDWLTTATAALEKKHFRYERHEISIAKSENLEYITLINTATRECVRHFKKPVKSANKTLDGASVNIAVNQHGSTRYFEVKAPTVDSHPLLIALISQSIMAFRNAGLISADCTLAIG